jgi:serine-type D-Ala-D-Ala carboxypeptidase (penicillin-binding protein 5/6)
MKNLNVLRMMRNELRIQRKTLLYYTDIYSGVLLRITRHPLRITVFLLVVMALLFSLPAVVYGSDIQSRAAVVLDATTGRILYAKNPELRLKPASTTKLMTAIVAVDKMNLSDVVTVSRKAAETAPIRAGFRAGDRVTIETLLYAALVKSGNDAAVALAEAVAGTEWEFVKLMNRKALAIGAHDTRFANSSGLPGKEQYITAYDLSKIMRHAIRHPVLREILGTRITEISTETGKTIFMTSTNKMLWSDDNLLGGKTGYTNQAKHCFVCAGERENETLVVALLGSPRRDLLWKETEDLMGLGSRVLANNEEPVIYLTRTDYGPAKVNKASSPGLKNNATVKKTVNANAKKTAVSAGNKGTKKKPVVSAGKKSAKKKPALAAEKQDTKKKPAAVRANDNKETAKAPGTEIKDIASKEINDDEG